MAASSCDILAELASDSASIARGSTGRAPAACWALEWTALEQLLGCWSGARAARAAHWECQRRHALIAAVPLCSRIVVRAPVQSRSLVWIGRRARGSRCLFQCSSCGCRSRAPR
jgi:hypothetical protein